MTQKAEAGPSGGDVRCRCGKLIARWDEYGLLIKCGRCRRLMRIPFAAIQGTASRVEETR